MRMLDYCGYCDKMVEYSLEKRENVERFNKGERFLWMKMWRFVPTAGMIFLTTNLKMKI
jgi:hypothetical protein